MHFLTDFADQAVILPLATVVGLILLSVGWYRGAFAWGFAVCGTLATMLGLKLCLIACGWRWPVLDIHSPSGHTASAGVVYGGLLSLALPGANLFTRFLVILAPTVLFAVTRIAVHAHTIPEVVAGGVVGVTGAFILTRMAGPRPQTMPRRRLRLLIGGAGLVIVILLHGRHLPAEVNIRHFTLNFWPMSSCRQNA